MTINHINIHTVQIPFRLSIDHNLKKRAYSESIVLAVHTKTGKVGYGEGAPRSYVTGESTQEVIAKFKDIFNQYPVHEFITLEDIKDISGWIGQKHKLPAIATALELALLDLLWQERGYSIAKLLSNEDYPLQYSAVLPYLPLEKMDKWLQIIKDLELKQVKVKVGHDDDVRHLTKVRKFLGDNIDIRVDANRAWTFEEAVKKIKQLENFNISCVEEPLLASETNRLPDLSRRINIPLLLDESVYTLDHAVYFSEKIAADKLMFNLKISKSGGLFRTAALHRFAQSKGIRCQLGCNVGETALLSAAGRLFAQSHQLSYLEGSYALFFMEDDISVSPISFSKKGAAQRIENEGLGITIDPKKLAKYTSSTVTIYPKVAKPLQ